MQTWKISWKKNLNFLKVGEIKEVFNHPKIIDERGDKRARRKWWRSVRRSLGIRAAEVAVAITWHAGWSAVAQVMSVNNRGSGNGGGDREENQPARSGVSDHVAIRAPDPQTDWLWAWMARPATIAATFHARGTQAYPPDNPSTHRVTTSHHITVQRRTIITVPIEYRRANKRTHTP